MSADMLATWDCEGDTIVVKRDGVEMLGISAHEVIETLGRDFVQRYVDYLYRHGHWQRRAPINESKELVALRLRVDDATEALEDERTALAHVTIQRDDAEVRLAAVGMLLDIMQRGCHDTIAAHKAIEFARDRAPWKNIMATVYGLDEVGAPLPKKRGRAKVGVA